MVNNLSALCAEIGLGRRLVISAAPYTRCKSASSPGVQIDLLIQTPKSVYVVEVKRQKKIEASIEQEIADKVAQLGLGPSRSVRTVLVYEGQLSPVVEENGYIDYLVPFSRLKGGGVGD